MLFREYKINDFISELSSDAPSPGGGSTAALVAALASSLNNMVYSLTIGKKCYESLTEKEKEKMSLFVDEANKITDDFLGFMERDRNDFMALMDSYKLPKESEEDKIQRSKVIREKTINAMETPLELARECISFYDNIEFAIDNGNKNLVSDAGVATILLHAALESAILNVKVNLSFLKGLDNLSEIEKECASLVERSKSEKERLSIKVNNIIL